MSNWPTSGNLTGTLLVGQGEPGKSLEYEWRGTELGIRVEGEEEYQFVNLAGGSGGANGREIELQVGSGYLQWRYKDEEEWNDLIAISALEGKQGPQGLPGKDGENGQDGRDGINGADGKSLDFNWNGTELGVKKEGQLEYSYVDLKGNTGNTGATGKDGVTPNIIIGTVTTLEAGEKATVTREGTKENPVFNFGIPKGEKGDTGTPNGGSLEDTVVTIPIIGNTLTLTTDKRQKTTMKNNTTIVLPVVDKFTEIHLIFSTTEELTLILPKIKWNNQVDIEANKTYEFIFTYIDNSWLGGIVPYV